MEKLLEVETARTLMTEAMTWSVMKWLREKKRVRKTADLANAALDQLSEAMRQAWPDRIKTTYEALAAQATGPAAAAHRQQSRRCRSAIQRQCSSRKSSRNPMTKLIEPEWTRKRLSTRQKSNLAPASRAKAAEKRSTPGTCTKRRFAEPKPLFPRNDEPRQQPLVDRHSDNSIHADRMQFIDFLLRSYPARRNELSGRRRA